MRIMLVLPVLLLGACNVAKDDANNTVSVTINEEVAANSLDNAGNTIENIASDVGNSVDNAGNRIDNTDVDVKVDTNTQDNKH